MAGIKYAFLQDIFWTNIWKACECNFEKHSCLRSCSYYRVYPLSEDFKYKIEEKWSNVRRS